MTIARSNGWMRIERLFRRACGAPRKSAMRIVALHRPVKESRRPIRIFSKPCLRRIHSKRAFFTYAFSVEYVLGFDGGGTKTECVLLDSLGSIVARSVSGPSNPARVGVPAATVEVKKAAELVLREAGAEQNAVAALGAGLAGTGQAEIRQRMHATNKEKSGEREDTARRSVMKVAPSI